ncbi:hypothetical protein N7931_00955 [Catenovulum sp. 2E275]|uniref:ATP-binding protein n=1 Tax=Catenovulum sp. 2E275 TaxID=2980497 RepID=UPI0021D1C72B|nr:ATP-binding protein [Catenovulum sp. 2E275]MCU4674190.1 hypothetical protein [Catenovulum sp. 2E275]
MSQINQKLDNLVNVLNQYPELAIAVSGGVDSMLLMYVAHKFSTTQATAIHAYSPAVPSGALTLINQYAENETWSLQLIDAQELTDERYRENPVNRCYYCKSKLYQRIGEVYAKTVASGTNLDDLGDYRPGLTAAAENKIVQPYVDANLSKADIYQLAADLNLTDLKQLPAQPCLASRLETGIEVDSIKLGFIDLVEQKIKAFMQSQETVRCRLTHQGVYVELGSIPKEPMLSDMMNAVKLECDKQGYIFSGVKHYQKGSAFIHPGVKV